MVIPAAALILFDYLRHFVFPYDFLHGWSGFLLLWALVLVGVLVFSQTVFALIDRMERQMLRHNRELGATAEIATTLGHSLKLEQMLSITLDKVLEIMGVQVGTICVLDETQGELVHLVYRGIPPEVFGPRNRTELRRDPIATRVVETEGPVVLSDLFDLCEGTEIAEKARKAGVRSAVSVPLMAEGKVVGILAVAGAEERHFLSSEVSMLVGIGNQLGMAVRNSVLFEDLVRRNRELAVLNRVSAAVGSSLDLDEVMAAAVDSVVELMGAEAGEIWLLNEDGLLLTLAVHRGLFAESFREIDRFRLGEGFPGLVAQSGEPIVTNDLLSEGQYLRASVKEKGFQFLACLPLKSRGRVLGTIDIASREKRELSPRDLELLSSVGSQIGVAIENASLHQKVQYMAILEERERIAREMHDGLAQILGYVNTKTQAVKRLLSQGQQSEAEESLGQLEDAAREVYADVREAILGLRTTTSAGRGLGPALSDYAEWFSRQNGIPVEVSAEDPADASLEPTIEVQLIRIVQEALSNVRKHADAKRAWVRFSTADGHLCLTVRDDGQGFDPGRISRGIWPKFGLATMRERAESVGSTLEVCSAPGRGTIVKVLVPRKAACLR